MRRRFVDEPTFHRCIAISLTPMTRLHFVHASSFRRCVVNFVCSGNTSKQIMRDWNSFMISSHAFDMSAGYWDFIKAQIQLVIGYLKENLESEVNQVFHNFFTYIVNMLFVRNHKWQTLLVIGYYLNRKCCKVGNSVEPGRYIQKGRTNNFSHEQISSTHKCVTVFRYWYKSNGCDS